jgi:hypothetical protein
MGEQMKSVFGPTSASNEARGLLRIDRTRFESLERRLTGAAGDLSNSAVPLLNLQSGFDAVAGPAAATAALRNGLPTQLQPATTTTTVTSLGATDDSGGPSALSADDFRLLQQKRPPGNAFDLDAAVSARVVVDAVQQQSRIASTSETSDGKRRRVGAVPSGGSPPAAAFVVGSHARGGSASGQSHSPPHPIILMSGGILVSGGLSDLVSCLKLSMMEMPLLTAC